MASSASTAPAGAGTVALSEDDLDELLYLSRAGEAAELAAFVNSLSSTHAGPPLQVLAAAVDPDTGSGCLHYAGANGHVEVLDAVAALHTASTPATTTTTTTATLTALLSARNHAGNTPLHFAALTAASPSQPAQSRERSLAFVRRALALGADPSVRNAAGLDAVVEAERAAMGAEEGGGEGKNAGEGEGKEQGKEEEEKEKEDAQGKVAEVVRVLLAAEGEGGEALETGVADDDDEDKMDVDPPRPSAAPGSATAATRTTG